MSKMAIMSDVHANPAALQTALEDARGQGCDKYVMLGDITGYGYDVQNALSLVRENFDVVLMGNHDSACIGLEPLMAVLMNPHYDIDREQREVLSREDRDWLRKLAYQYGEGDFICVHADVICPKAWGYILGTEDAARNFFQFSERILFCGHSHRADVWEFDCNGLIQERCGDRLTPPALEAESVSLQLTEGSRYIVNVGSVGYPRNDHCSVYGIYDDRDKCVTLRRLPFDFAGYIEAMLRHGLELPQWIDER